MPFIIIIIIIVVVVVVVVVISLMQGIYTYIPDTNHVSNEYSVAAILQLLFTVHTTLFALLNQYFPKYVCERSTDQNIQTSGML